MSEHSSSDVPTLADPRTAKPSGSATSLTPPPGSSVRSTVLPRLERGTGAPQLVVAGKPRYEELRPLGAGGQAEVTLARDHDIDRPVAVKRLLPERVDDDAILRFTEEIRTVGQLEHPNIVPIHDVGVDAAGQYFFVMKYVEGETLDAIIEKLRAGDPAYAAKYTHAYRLQICYEILRGMEHAHQLGVLHRDLKPANIMVGSLGEVVIMDWGVAKRMGAPEPARTGGPTGTERLFETVAGALVGTPAYMAPEQAAGRLDAMDARSDVYSLAVVFYELLSLRHPRRHCNTVPAVLAAVMHEPVTLTQLFSDFTHGRAPAALGHFVRHALAIDPKERYPSVAAMRERLEAVRDGRAPIECHVTFAQRVLDTAGRGANRHPIALGIGFVVTAVAALAGVATLVLHAVR